MQAQWNQGDKPPSPSRNFQYLLPVNFKIVQGIMGKMYREPNYIIALQAMKYESVVLIQ